MTLHDSIALSFIRYFIHPFAESNPVEYKSGLKQAKRILISCPAGEKKDHYGISIEDFTALFQGKEIKVHTPNKNSRLISKERESLGRLPGQIRFRLFRLFNSAFIGGLKRKTPDVLIDLDPNFNLMNVYLCRTLKIPVRIGFNKPFSHLFYNLQFECDSNLSYPERREKLFQFLQQLLKK